MKAALHALALIAVVLFAVPARPAPPPEGGSPTEGGWYRATLAIDKAHEIPFFLWLPDDDEQDAVIRNGLEDIAVLFEREGAHIVLDFPHYDSRIEAELDLTNHYRGVWRKQRREGVAEMPFAADRLPAPHPLATFSPEFGARYPLSGASDTIRFAMAFAEDGPAIASMTLGRRVAGPEFHLREVTGTIQTTTGDYRFLSGVWESGAGAGRNANDLMLSVFDGAHAFLFAMTESADAGDLAGDFYSGNWFHDTFTARRLADGEAYELPDPFSEVSLTAGDGRLHIDALDSPRYHGKPVIVQIFGTWCPNCHDETPALVDLYTRYHDDGLEVLGLAYEVTGDDARSRRQVRRFIERYSIPWDIVIAGTNDKDQSSATLPDLSRVKSFPTTIWIGRDGRVRAIHSGFSGPATGAAHTALLAEFDRLTRAVVEDD